MEGMKEYSDNHFDLAIVDPPYGGGNHSMNNLRTGGTWAAKYGKKINDWDKPPTQEYFDELFRVSKNQIVWGANYFTMPPSRCFIIFYKPFISENFTMSMCEYAWTSFDDNAKLFTWKRNKYDILGRTHPTQKPISLYKWILKNYAKQGDLILDTHVGSASSLIACEQMGFDYVGFELDKDYYKAAKQRIQESRMQTDLFRPEVVEEVSKQETLF
jgi:site-specific DNA-methyltransferase (adenine-specific)